MKLIASILALVALSLSAQVSVTGKLVPGGTGFPIIDTAQALGGLQSVADHTAITSDKLAAGMEVFETSTGYRWRLNSDGSTWARADGDFKFTWSGLTLTVAPGKVVDAAGGLTAFTGASTNLIASYTNYIYLINSNGTPVLMPMSRNIHRGGVYLGQAITGASAVSSVVQPLKFEYSKTRVGRWLRRQAHLDASLLTFLGDSYTGGAQATGGSNFYNLMLNSSYSSYGLNIPNVANVTGSKMGQSGNASVWALVYSGEVIARTSGGSGAYQNTSAHRTRLVNNSIDTSRAKFVGPGNQMRPVPDLIITGFGNGSSYSVDESAIQFETAVRRFIANGTDVIIHTEAPFYNDSSLPGTINNWTVLRDGPRLEAIADSSGAELCDTFGMMQWLHDAGLITTYWNGDWTHPNNAGHFMIAILLDSIAAPLVQLESEPYSVRRRSQYLTGAGGGQNGLGVDLNFDYAGTGATGSDPLAAGGAINMNVIATGVSSGASVYNLTAGQKVECVHGGCLSVGVISALGPGTTAVCHMEDNGATQVGSSFTIIGGYAQPITKIFNSADFVTIGVGNYKEGGNSPSRLPCYGIDLYMVVDSFTGGATTLPVVGFVFETPKRSDLIPKFLGKWGRELSGTTHEGFYYVPYSDTAGASMVFQFDTDMAEVWIVEGSQVGNIDVVVDGEMIINNAKLSGSANSGYIYHLFVQPNNSPANHTTQGTYRTARSLHTASIYLRIPGSSPVTGNHSIEVLAVNGLNFE